MRNKYGWKPLSSTFSLIQNDQGFQLSLPELQSLLVQTKLHSLGKYPVISTRAVTKCDLTLSQTTNFRLF